MVLACCCMFIISQLSICTHRIAWCYLFNSTQTLLRIITGCHEQPSHNHTCFMPKNMSFGCHGDPCKHIPNPWWTLVKKAGKLCTWLASIFNDSSVRFIPWGDLGNAGQLILLTCLRNLRDWDKKVVLLRKLQSTWNCNPLFSHRNQLQWHLSTSSASGRQFHLSANSVLAALALSLFHFHAKRTCIQ